MFLNTYSKASMEESICEFLDISSQDLISLFKTISVRARNEKYFNGDICDEIVNEFISSHMPNKIIDKILFFHLARRLNQSNNSVEGNNLLDLLTTENEFSSFLRKHEITFSVSDSRGLNLFYKGELKSLENTSIEGVCYLRSRLGYNQGREDYCFNGFAFRDLIYRNHYTRDLFHGPEFMGVLTRFLKCHRVLENFNDQSKFYCFDYCVPFDRVFFDDNDNMSQEQKTVYLIKQIITRLYEHSEGDIRYNFDHNNPILRLSDTETMNEEYFINKVEIDHTMLD